MADIRAVVITVSDTRNTENDASGKRLCELLVQAGASIVEKILIVDDLDGIREVLEHYAKRDDVNVILTTGGTGLAERDNTPEATRSAIEREVPGISEAMRIQTLSKTPKSILSRGVSGTLSGTLIVNLPGSTSGVEDCFEVLRPVLGHAVNQLAGETKH